jgi:hypothetical protein
VGTPYNGNPTATQSPSLAPGPGIYPTLDLPADSNPNNAATFAQAYKVLADFIAYLQGDILGRNNPCYGTGEDGDQTIPFSFGGTPLTRHMNYNNLTVGGLLNTQGYWVRVKNTLTINAGIRDNGGDAADRNAFPVSPTRAYEWSGKQGASALAAAGTTPHFGDVTGLYGNPAFMFGGGGGRGGNASGGTLGGDGAALSPAFNTNVDIFGALVAGGLAGCVDALSRNFVTQLIVGGMGGGAGATQDASNQGGGGGEGGGVVLIAAKKIVVTGTFGGRAIQALGGNGGPASGANGGGGGGGGGGFVGVLCSSWSGEALGSSCVDPGVAGGAGAATSGGPGNFRVFVLGA